MDANDEPQIEFTITSFSACCRVCLSSNENEQYYDIYLDTLVSHSEISLIEAIQKVANVEVLSSSKLPTRICSECATRLDDAYNFVLDVYRNNEILQDYLDGEEIGKAVVEELDLSTVHELCEPEPTDQPTATTVIEVYENENEAEEQSDNRSVSDEPPQDSQPEDPAKRTAETPQSAVTAVDFILQQVKPARRKVKRRVVEQTKCKHHCTECNKSFLRRSNLIDHLRLHAQVKLYACDYCDKRFVQPGNLKSHMRTHTAERPFSCDICSKGFTQSSSLKTHMMTHSKVKPFGCDVCDKAFVSSSDLYKHKLTHSSQKQYRCVICQERYFTQKVHLRCHLMRMHPTTNVATSLEAGIIK